MSKQPKNTPIYQTAKLSWKTKSCRKKSRRSAIDMSDKEGAPAPDTGMSPTDTTESMLESIIAQNLVDNAGYVQGDPKDYDRDHAVDLTKLLDFFLSTQPKVVSQL